MAAAQELPEVKTGQTVWAVMADGHEIKGKVIDFSQTSLEITHKGQSMSVPLADLERIEVRDSVKNGAKIGAVPGAIVLGFLFGAAAEFSACPLLDPRPCDSNAGAWTVVGGAAGAGAGWLIGAGIDRLIPGRKVVYLSNGATAHVTVSPAVGPRGAGARVSVSW